MPLTSATVIRTGEAHGVDAAINAIDDAEKTVRVVKVAIAKILRR
jgi:hypothetical protein